jgi:hypothetical protein
MDVIKGVFIGCYIEFIQKIHVDLFMAFIYAFSIFMEYLLSPSARAYSGQTCRLFRRKVYRFLKFPVCYLLPRHRSIHIL